LGCTSLENTRRHRCIIIKKKKSATTRFGILSANYVACYIFKAAEEEEEDEESRARRKREIGDEGKKFKKCPDLQDFQKRKKTYLIMTLYLVFSAESGSPVRFLIFRMSA